MQFGFVDFAVFQHFIGDRFEAYARIVLQVVGEHLVQVDRVVLIAAYDPRIHLGSWLYLHRPN